MAVVIVEESWVQGGLVMGSEAKDPSDARATACLLPGRGAMGRAGNRTPFLL